MIVEKFLKPHVGDNRRFNETNNSVYLHATAAFFVCVYFRYMSKSPTKQLADSNSPTKLADNFIRLNKRVVCVL